MFQNYLVNFTFYIKWSIEYNWFPTHLKVKSMKHKNVLIVENPSKLKASNYFIEFDDRDGKSRYVTTVEIWYKSKRYNKWIVLEKYFDSDGATGAYDINSFGWLMHDKLCNTGKFNDASTCSNWQASKVLRDILDEESRWVRKHTWFWATWLFGGGKARKNGMY